MESLPPADRSESPDERTQRRRARRWMRRAQMAGPFLGFSVVLAALALSIDLVEYQPEPPAERLSDRPIPDPRRERVQGMPAAMPSALSAASVLGSEPSGGSDLLGGDAENLDVDLAADAALSGEHSASGRPLAGTADAPTPPSMLRTSR